MGNKLVFYPPAERYLAKIIDKELKRKFREAIDRILEDPTLGTAKTGDLKGMHGYDFYYNKTNYELAYTIIRDNQGNIVVIIMAGTRENFYEELKSFLRKKKAR